MATHDLVIAEMRVIVGAVERVGMVDSLIGLIAMASLTVIIHATSMVYMVAVFLVILRSDNLIESLTDCRIPIVREWNELARLVGLIQNLILMIWPTGCAIALFQMGIGRRMMRAEVLGTLQCHLPAHSRPRQSEVVTLSTPTDWLLSMPIGQTPASILAELR